MCEHCFIVLLFVLSIPVYVCGNSAFLAAKSNKGYIILRQTEIGAYLSHSQPLTLRCNVCGTRVILQSSVITTSCNLRHVAIHLGYPMCS